MKKGEVWFAKFPYEEDKTRFKPRPVVVMNEEDLTVLSIKVTSHAPRDHYDVVIQHWQEAHLMCPSVARVSKVRALDREDFFHRLGELHISDLHEIEVVYGEFIQECKKKKARQ